MHDRGLKQFSSVQDGKLQEYEDISRLANAGLDKIGQILKGHSNGLHLEPKYAWQQNISPGAHFCPTFSSFGCLEHEFNAS